MSSKELNFTQHWVVSNFTKTTSNSSDFVLYFLYVSGTIAHMAAINSSGCNRAPWLLPNYIFFLKRINYESFGFRPNCFKEAFAVFFSDVLCFVELHVYMIVHYVPNIARYTSISSLMR